MVIIEETDSSEDLSDDVDIIELVEVDSFTCGDVGNYPNPIYCDKYYSCQPDNEGELQVRNILKALRLDVCLSQAHCLQMFAANR